MQTFVNAIILFQLFKFCNSRHVMKFNDKTFSRSMDICIVTPIYYPKNRNFLDYPLHRNSIYIIGVDTDEEKFLIENNSQNETIVVYRAIHHIDDALYALYQGATMCKQKGFRFMFIFEMDLKFERRDGITHSNVDTLQSSLHELLREHSMPFWMLGSEYIGPLTILHPEHLNGNAIYDLGSYCFALAMHYLLTTHSGGNGYDVFLVNFVRDAHPICKKTYSSTSRICNYWRIRTNMTNDRRCWFVHY